MGEEAYWQRLNRKRFTRRALLGVSAKAGLGAAGLALVGCGDDDDDDAGVARTPAPSREEPAEGQSAQQAAESAEAPAEAPSGGDDGAAAPAADPTFRGEGLVVGAGRFDWQISRVDQGTKPGVALDVDQAPLIAYMLERRGAAGFVRVARGGANGFSIDTLQTGYLYGPLDIRVAPSGIVAVAYHNHDWEDGAVAVRDGGGGWQVNRIRDGGHDGWDSALAFGPAGTIHFLGVDPEQFGASDGVEFATLANGEFQVEPVGSGPQPYEWGVGVAVDAGGVKHVTFFDAGTQDLVYGRNDGGGWQLQTIYENGDAGRFNVLAVADDGTPHVAFFQTDDGVDENGRSPGNIVYGTLNGAAWSFEIIGTVDDHVLGFEGARRTVAIDLAAGEPVVAFIDESALQLATRSGGLWELETVLEAGADPLQVVGLVLNAAADPHLTFSTITSNGPLDGEVWYVAPLLKA